MKGIALEHSEQSTFALSAETIGFWAGIDWPQASVQLIGAFIVAVVAGFIAGQVSGRKLVRFQNEHQRVTNDLVLLERIRENLMSVREYVLVKEKLHAEHKKLATAGDRDELLGWEKTSGWRVASNTTGSILGLVFHESVGKLRAKSHMALKQRWRKFYKHSHSVAVLDGIVESIEKILDYELGPEWRND